MTAPIYSAPKDADIVAMRVIASSHPRPLVASGISQMISADAPPAIPEASTYFQAAAITGAIPRPIGLPAYQNAGPTRIQKEAAQATAIPTGPQWSPMTNKSPVTMHSATPHRN